VLCPMGPLSETAHVHISYLYILFDHYEHALDFLFMNAMRNHDLNAWLARIYILFRLPNPIFCITVLCTGERDTLPEAVVSLRIVVTVVTRSISRTEFCSSELVLSRHFC